MNHIINFKNIIFEKNFRFCYQNNNLEITNYESIPLFNFEEIDIKYNNGMMIIYGENLVISKLEKDELLITGNINNIEIRKRIDK